MRNEEVAAALYEIADLVEVVSDEDRFRPISYRRAARAIEGLAEDVDDLATAGRLEQIPGVGRGIAAKIRQFLRDGRIDELEDLRAKFPPGLLRVLRIPDLGPKTVRRLYLELGIQSLDDLRKAAESGRLRRLKGFGEKTEQNILRGIALLEQARGRILLWDALLLAERIIGHLRKTAPVDRISVAGSIRRMRETIGDIDLLATTTRPLEVARAFTTMRTVQEVVLSGETKSTVLVQEQGTTVQVDLRVLEPSSWGAGLQYFTGNKDHNVKLRGIAQRRGLKLNEYGLFRDEALVAGATEEEVYAALDLAYMEPEMREDTGEIEAALEGPLPRLVTLDDVRGDLHSHTNVTDGVNTLEEMAAAAKARGYEYLGVSDHSPYLRVANGLSEENLRIHVAHIRAVDERGTGVRLLAGTECDILADGRMDYPDRVLRDLDYVIASVHSNFKMSEEDMTRRVVRAMENEHVDILAHPMTRKIGQRPPVALDWDRVMEMAASTGTVVEINAYPDRMDLDGSRAKLAKEHGAKLVIDTDSHAIGHLEYMRAGIGTARRGWLEPSDVVNTMAFGDLIRFFR